MSGGFRLVSAILLVIALVGCRDTAEDQSAYRNDLEAAMTAANVERIEQLGIEVSDDGITCMVRSALSGYSDPELREAGVTADNVVERLPELNVELHQARDWPRIATAIDDFWHCLDQEDFIALTATDPVGEEVLRCMIDEIGYETMVDFNVEQSIAEDAGGDPVDTSAVTVAAESCAQRVS